MRVELIIFIGVLTATCLVVVYFEKLSSWPSRLSTVSSSSHDGWHDMDVSVASQGKLWKPVKFRSYPDRLLRFSKTYTLSQSAPPRTGPKCQRWSVVTTIFPPTKLLRQLRSLPGWCLVVVGDRKTNETLWYTFAHAAQNSTVFLSAADQEMLPYATAKTVPWNHFGRKNVGYLYAIHRGAEIIWDTDDDNVLKNLSSLLTLAKLATDNSTHLSMIENGHFLWNPYPYFRPFLPKSGTSQSIAWPRGLPLSFVKDSGVAESRSTTTTPNRYVSVYQSLADNDPDVDAVYRLTQPLPLSFNPHANSPATLVLPSKRFAPFNAQATLWLKSGFWGLLLPISVHGRVSDIWRSYITQRLMQETGSLIAFVAPVVTQFRNVHSYMADLQAEIPLYTQAHELIKWLLNWTDDSPTSLPLTMERLVVNLYEIGILENSDISAVQAWLSDLVRIGYSFPEILAVKNRTNIGGIDTDTDADILPI